MLKIDTESRKGILIGIASSAIFLVFLQPILELLTKFSYNLLNTFFSSILDDIYRQAAVFTDGELIAAIFSSGGSILLGLILGLLSFNISRLKRSGGESKRVTRIPPKVKRILLIIYLLIICIMIFYSIITKSLVAQIKSNFEEALAIVAPYIDEQLEEELYAEWVAMENKNDFDALNEKFFAIGEQYGIKLPADK